MLKVISAAIKRICDIILSLFGVLALVPISIGVFIAYRSSGDKAPIFYTQKRIGKGGKEFGIIKYRSMIPGADEVLKAYLKKNPQAAAEYKKYKKLENDFRITPVGKFLRRTSLDEFPQFINVLLGNMSIVGPRPYLVTEKRAMGNKYESIIKVKPGLTGPWQVSGRSSIPFKERLAIESNYAKNHTLRLDVKYAFKTVSKLFGDNNAF